MFQENFKKSFKDVCFKECLNEVLPSNFVVTRISSQLTEQKEDLFSKNEIKRKQYAELSVSNRLFTKIFLHLMSDFTRNAVQV